MFIAVYMYKSLITKTNKMKKTIISVLVLAAAAFTSCEKVGIDNPKSIGQQASEEEATVQLKSTEYERREVGSLEQIEEHQAFSSGSIEYWVDGELQSVVSFDDDRIEVYENGELVSEREMDRDTRRCGNHNGPRPEMDGDMDKKGKHKFGKKKGKKGKKGDYEKVIVEPIVKTDDCEYPVAGTIEFLKEGTWVATIDFGDGTCDDQATKTTTEGVYTFSIDEWKNK
jgi:hypothetical protein